MVALGLGAFLASYEVTTRMATDAENNVERNLALNAFHKAPTRVDLPNIFFNQIRNVRFDSVDLVDDKEIAGDNLLECGLSMVEIAVEILRIDDGDDAVEPKGTGGAAGLQFHDDRFGIGKTARFDKQCLHLMLGGHDVPQRPREVALRRATNASVGKLDYGSGRTCYESRVNPELPKLIDDDANLAPMTSRKDVIDEGGFTGAQKSREQGDWKRRF